MIEKQIEELLENKEIFYISSSIEEKDVELLKILDRLLK